MEGFSAEQLTEEGQALVAEAENEAQEALALLQHARRTLREAREKQHQVKLSRQYFRPGANRGPSGATSSTGSSRPSHWGGSKGTGARDDSKMMCLKCGKIGHRAANCPQKEQQANHTEETAESAPFICFSEMALSATTDEISFSEAALSATMSEAMMTTQEAMRKGWCVIDGGATRTLGSMVALQSVVDCNTAQTGQTKVLKVATDRRPTFSFGNSSENTCVSTMELGVQAGNKEGKLTVHALDAGSGPVLLSVASLRSLGAIVDFAEDLVVFRNLDAKRIIQAKRSQSGHQLLPLCGDMYEHSSEAKQPIQNLRDFIPSGQLLPRSAPERQRKVRFVESGRDATEDQSGDNFSSKLRSEGSGVSVFHSSLEPHKGMIVKNQGTTIKRDLTLPNNSSPCGSNQQASSTPRHDRTQHEPEHDDQGSAAGPPTRSWRGATRRVDGDGVTGSIVRAGSVVDGADESGSSQDRTPKVGGPHQTRRGPRSRR